MDPSFEASSGKLQQSNQTENKSGLIGDFDVSDETFVHPLMKRLAETSGLENLALKLSEKLCLRGCEPKGVSDSFAKTKNELQFERKRFLKAKAVENSLEEIITDFEIRATSAENIPSVTEHRVKIK